MRVAGHDQIQSEREMRRLRPGRCSGDPVGARDGSYRSHRRLAMSVGPWLRSANPSTPTTIGHDGTLAERKRSSIEPPGYQAREG